MLKKKQRIIYRFIYKGSKKITGMKIAETYRRILSINKTIDRTSSFLAELKYDILRRRANERSSDYKGTV